MKKALIVLVIAVLGGAAALLFTPQGQEILPEKILKKSISDHTPEERWSYIEKKVKNIVLESLQQATEGNYLQEFFPGFSSEKFLMESNSTFTFYGIPSVPTEGFVNAVLTAQYTGKLDNSTPIRPQSEGSLVLDLTTNFEEPLTTQIGSDSATINAGLDLVSDGEDVYIRLEEINSSNPLLLPLNSPEIAPILTEVQNKWIYFNEAMTNPIFPEGTDLNQVNEAFLGNITQALTEDIESFTMFQQPVIGQKIEDWYVYDLTVDNTALETSVKNMLETTMNTYADSVFTNKDETTQAQKEFFLTDVSQLLEAFSLEYMGAITAKISFHETKTDDFKAIINYQNPTTKDSVTVSIEHVDKKLIGSIGVNNVIVASWNITEDSINITAPSTMFTMNNNAFTLDVVHQAQQHIVTGTRNDENATISYTIDDVEMATGTFAKNNDIWSGTMDISPMQIVMKVNKFMYQEDKKGLSMSLDTDIAFMQEDVVSIDMNSTVKEDNSIQVIIPQDVTPLPTILESIFGFNPYNLSTQNDELTEEEIEALLESFETTPIEPIATE